MKNHFLFFSLVLGAAVILTSCNTTSHVEVAQGVNFSNYKTFGWLNDSLDKSGRTNNDIVDNNIKNSISTQLEKQGWKETDQQPDVLVDYNVMVKKGVREAIDPVYNYPFSGYYFNPWRHRMGYFYNPNVLRGYNTYNVPFKEGTLTVNMLDAKTNKLIWQGYSTGDVSSKNVTTQEAQADVKSIFRKFHLPVTNS
jgi:hypothetical protein